MVALIFCHFLLMKAQLHFFIILSSFLFCIHLFAAMAIDDEDGDARLELLDPAIDRQHRSYMSAVRGLMLKTLRARVPMSTMPIYQRWIPKYVAAFISLVVLYFI